MSGLEVAAFVIGAIPLVVEFLKSGAVGIDNARSLISKKRYQLQLNNWCTTLTTQRTIMFNSVALIIRALDCLEHESDIEAMLDKGTLPVLVNNALSQRLDVLLGHNREAFHGNILMTRILLEDFEQRIGSKSKDLQQTPSGSRTWTSWTLQSKFVLNKKLYQELLDQLRQANEHLDTIRQQAIELESSGQKVKAFHRPLQRLRKLRESARQAFQTLTSSRSWPCKCAKGHSVLLRLEAQQSRKPGEDASFLVSFTDDLVDFPNVAATGFQTFRINVINEEQSTPPLQHHEVKFSIPTFAQPTNRIHDLCAFLMNHPPAVATGTHLGFTGHGKSPEAELYAAHDDYGGCGTISLASLLTLSSQCVGCVRHIDMLENDDRLILAAELASSTFALQGHWLKDQWTCENILVPVSANKKAPFLRDLHAVTVVKSATLPSTAAITSTSLCASTSPSSNPLRHLGEALAAILTGQDVEPTSPQNRPVVSGNAPATSSVVTFDEALTLLYKRYGRDINNPGNAVRECYYWSGPATTKHFDDESFSYFAYERIIWPIVDQARRHQGLTI